MDMNEDKVKRAYGKLLNGKGILKPVKRSFKYHWAMDEMGAYQSLAY